jgi:hypothetical protein
MKKIVIFNVLINLITISSSFGNEEILKKYEKDAKSLDPKFVEFSLKEGEKLFRNERQNSKNEKVSCMTCHTSDPRKEGLTRANKVVLPLAPISNQDRFTDILKVEKWFKRNCKDVYERECTIIEKGNFVKYMMSIK